MPARPGRAGNGTFAWCVLEQSSIASDFLEVRLRPVVGREDQAGGVVWRWKGGGDYVARANALENNVSLYYTQRGRRRAIRYVAAPLTRDAWHTLRVEFRDARTRVLLHGRLCIEADDAHLTGVERVGVWTNADSVTDFDDFSFGATR